MLREVTQESRKDFRSRLSKSNNNPKELKNKRKNIEVKRRKEKPVVIRSILKMKFALKNITRRRKEDIIMNLKKKILRNLRKEIKSKKEKENNHQKKNDQVIQKSEEALTKRHQLRLNNSDQKKTENQKWKKKAHPQKRK